MTTRAITATIRPALRAVSKGQPYFLKREVVNEVLRRADIATAVIEIRRTWRGRGLDEAILGYVDTEVGKALRRRDDRGLRMYECYTAGSQHRWRRLVEMDATDLRRVIDDMTTLRDQLDAKVRAYSILLERMEARGATARVSEVVDDAWAAILVAVPVDRLAA